jgi:hypothetical protein
VWRIDVKSVLARLPTTPRRVWQFVGLAVSATALTLTMMPQGPFQDVYAKGMWLAMIDKSYLSDFFVSIYSTQIEPVKIPVDADRSIV